MPLLTVSERRPDGSPVLDEGESVIKVEQNVALFFDTTQMEGVGTLFITSKHVIWLSAADTSKGYSMDYYFISLHALSTDTTAFPHSCIYCQLESETTPEARFVLQDPTHLKDVYQGFCDGAILNPDLEEEGEGDFIYNEEEVERGLHGENHSGMEGITENGQFDDDDDEEEDDVEED